MVNISNPSNDHLVVIFLCTYNGENFLSAQLNSIMEQTHKSWIILASDDGSTDLTMQILYEYQKKLSTDRLIIKQGPCKGYSQNFLSLVFSCKINADYYAFCDQDDVWKPDKLKVAVNNLYLNQIPNQPYLYCGRSIYVLEDLTPITLSPLKKYKAVFENALIENIAGGNTMLFNKATKNIIERVGLVDVVSHDWWIYILVTGVGGRVFYDQEPHILYRQHSKSVIGSGHQFIERTKRIYSAFKKTNKIRNTQNIINIMKCRQYLGSEQFEILELFSKLREARILNRVSLIVRLNLFKQNNIENIGLMIALLFKRI